MKIKMVNTSIAAAALLGLLDARASAMAVQRPAGSNALTAVAAAQNYTDDEDIRQAFRDILGREPSGSELRRYRNLMRNEGWTERDIRRDIRARDRDNTGRDDRYSNRGTGDDATRIVRRAYRDVLNRDPDAEGLRLYRNHVLDDGWSEAQVRETLRNSPEYRERGSFGNFGRSNTTMERAQDVVRRAYQSVLRREPDAGAQGYVDRVLRDGWSQQDVEQALRNSDEYRNRR